MYLLSLMLTTTHDNNTGNGGAICDSLSNWTACFRWIDSLIKLRGYGKIFDQKQKQVNKRLDSTVQTGIIHTQSI